MLVQKWNYETISYDKHIIPAQYHCPLVSYNMKEIVNCASCLKEVEFGECYTSRKIHNQYGLGYSVCEDCHEKEFAEEEKYRNGKK